ncbi:MAG TPA: hypothetical protein PL096_00890 [Micropepsaceae bacterium]|nr:hypothetical protein [Micropepsaceae bacterium]
MAQASPTQDPLPVVTPGNDLPPLRAGLGLALLIATFLVAAQFVLELTLRDGIADPVGRKLDLLAEQGANVDVILVGTSRTFYGFDPVAFSSGAREAGCNWTALNMGIAMMDRATEAVVAGTIADLPPRKRIVLFESLPLMLTSNVSAGQIDFGDLVRFGRAALPVQENRTDLSLDILWAADRIVASSALISTFALTGPDPMQPDFARGGQLVAESYKLAPPAANLLVNTHSWVSPGEGAANFIALRTEEIAGNWLSGLYAFPALSVSGREFVLADEAERQNLAYFNLNADAVRSTLTPEDWFDTWHLSRSGADKVSRALGAQLCARFGAAMADEGN